MEHCGKSSIFLFFFQESKDNALTLTKVAGIFYILVAGLALSVISVVLEFLYKTKVDSRRQNVSK